MNKADLIKNLSEKENIPWKAAKVIVDLLFDGMTESLVKGERIEVRGFGSFMVKNYGGYKGRNPKTGEIVDVPPKRFPFFKVGKELKEMVNVEGKEVLMTFDGDFRRG
jgi:integration host factor subunit beta